MDRVTLKELITRWVERGLLDDDGIVTRVGTHRSIPVAIPPRNRAIASLTGRRVDELLTAEEAGLEV
jgi:hypothetical protein